MPAAFLHGIETVEIDDGIRPIETVKSSIIGLIGTAPDLTLIVKNSLMVRTEPPGAQRRFDAGRVGGGDATAVEPSLSDPRHLCACLQSAISPPCDLRIEITRN